MGIYSVWGLGGLVLRGLGPRCRDYWGLGFWAGCAGKTLSGSSCKSGDDLRDFRIGGRFEASGFEDLCLGI